MPHKNSIAKNEMISMGKMVSEKEIQVFIDGIKHYFKTVSDSQAVVGTPYIIDTNEMPSNDYIGIINVSGLHTGKIYFLAAKAMLNHLLLSFGEKNISSELIVDIVGEVANTISGNVREIFGSQFHISVPIIRQPNFSHDELFLDNKSFSVPFRWKSYTAYLVVCLK